MVTRGCYAEKTNRAGGAFSSPRARIARKLRLRRALQPIIDILARPVLGESVALLDFAFELVTLSVDLSRVVIGEFAERGRRMPRARLITQADLLAIGGDVE